MGLFDKLKDMGQNVLTGGFNHKAQAIMAQQAQMPSTTNPDGSMSQEGMAAHQEQARNAMNNNPWAKMLIPKDVMAGFSNTMEDAFAKQKIMAEMMQEHQQKKVAEAQSLTAKDIDATEG